MKLNVVLFNAILVLVIGSCSRSVEYTEVYQNASSYEIQLIASYQIVGDDSLYYDTINLATNDEHIEYKISGAKSVNELSECGKFHYIEKVIVKNNDTLIVDIDLSITDNWEFNILSEKRFGKSEAECRLVVTDNNIH